MPEPRGTHILGIRALRFFLFPLALLLFSAPPRTMGISILDFLNTRCPDEAQRSILCTDGPVDMCIMHGLEIKPL